MRQNKAHEWAGSVASNPRHSAYTLVTQLDAIENDLSLLGKLRSRTPSTKNSPLRRPSPLKDYSNYVPVRKQSRTPSRDHGNDVRKSHIEQKFKELQDKTKGLDLKSKQFEAEMLSIKRKIKFEQRSLMQLKVKRGDRKLSLELHSVLGKLSHCFLRKSFQQLKQSDDVAVRRERRIVRKMEQYRAGEIFKHWRDYYLKEAAVEAALTHITTQKLNQRRAKKVLEVWSALARVEGTKRAKLSKTISYDARANLIDMKPTMTPKSRNATKITVASLLRVSPSWLNKVKKSPLTGTNRRYNSTVVTKTSSPVPSSTSTSPVRSKLTIPSGKNAKPRLMRPHSALTVMESSDEKKSDAHYKTHLKTYAFHIMKRIIQANRVFADNHFRKKKLSTCFSAMKPDLSTESTDSAFRTGSDAVSPDKTDPLPEGLEVLRAHIKAEQAAGEAKE
eukprot:CAMPEP_0204896594 /NCGR_PEP_ID=MMETSP1397-20131031/254_1 /ASSEMBLY_ACC=CAM_ASM_000891 /TAXON_ID=49980 /ORGANISM="Climacostomum Climacostomum virens, Strain Stock W-24" /LENGTH=445 /DNA_ID=CAMNT_0052064227 /DNA_START=167 /DNA_END=1503 /DNA_ORIENTATION=+